MKENELAFRESIKGNRGLYVSLKKLFEDIILISDEKYNVLEDQA